MPFTSSIPVNEIPDRITTNPTYPSGIAAFTPVPAKTTSPAFRSRLFVTLRSSPADPSVFRTGTRSGCSTLTCSFTFSPPISHAASVFTNPAIRKEFVEHVTLATARIRVEDQKHTALTILGHHRQYPAFLFVHGQKTVPHLLLRHFFQKGVAFDPVVTDEDFEIQSRRLRNA